MILPLLLLLAQNPPPDAAARLREEFEGLGRTVETQQLSTVEDLLATLAALRESRAKKDAAETARLERLAGKLERRLTAEVEEFQERAVALQGAVDEACGRRPDDLALLEVRVRLDGAHPDPRRHNRALADLDRLEAASPGRLDLRALRASLLLTLGRAAQARELLQEASKQTPSNPEILAVLGLAELQLFDFAAAGPRLRGALASRTALRPALAARALLAVRELELIDRDRAADTRPRAALVTAKGRIVVELFEDDAPNTTANFITLARQKFYDGTTFHRVEPNFVVQGGDPNSRNSDPRDDGAGGPGYTIPDELDPGYRRHVRGSVSMAHAGRNTGGCQFFIAHRPLESLDGRHTVFGRVIEGMEVVDRLAPGDVIVRVEVVRARRAEYAVRRN